ncbi:alpha/beta hydrolase [Micromonospora nigra]|uniref:alpha/beta hydrolase n=1 Tax=Micromonospora nigra TaxID=145857 RepID=UPI000B0249C3|nr:alpha/beta hydrolase [Micromonospora nigra]
MRGHGQSSAGWSSYAPADHPELVGGLVLTGAFVGQPRLNPLMRLAVAAVLRSPRLFGMFHRTLFPVHRPADDAAYRRAMVANLREPGRMAATRGVAEPVEPHWTAGVADVRQPVLVLTGAKDPDFPDPARADGVRTGRRLSRVAHRAGLSATVRITGGRGGRPSGWCASPLGAESPYPSPGD